MSRTYSAANAAVAFALLAAYNDQTSPLEREKLPVPAQPLVVVYPGSVTRVASAVNVAGAGQVTAVATAEFHVRGVRTGEAAECWGDQ